MREILFRGQIRKKGEKVRLDGSPVDGIWISAAFSTPSFLIFRTVSLVLCKDFKDYKCGLWFYAIRDYEKEVIGNIHDNPEMLKGVNE